MKSAERWRRTSLISSLSIRRVWIEMVLRTVKVAKRVLSLSIRRVWIEISDQQGYRSRYTSHSPHRECGLKLSIAVISAFLSLSLSLRRVWIEILKCTQRNSSHTVTFLKYILNKAVMMNDSIKSTNLRLSCKHFKLTKSLSRCHIIDYYVKLWLTNGAEKYNLYLKMDFTILEYIH